MAKTKTHPGLEINEDVPFQEKEWKVERAGWIVMLVFLLAGFLGLFGGGPLSQYTREEGPLRVELHRFARYRSPEELVITVDGAAASGGSLRVWLGRDYLSRFELEQITPEPESTQLYGDRVVYEFQAPDPGQPLKITFQVQAEQVGAQQGRLGLEGGGPSVQYTQLIFP